MKKYYSILAAILASGLAQGAETAYTTPVGYETLTLAPSEYNFLGLRLQRPVINAGKVTDKSSLSITLSSPPTLDSATTYILEINNASGVTQEFLGSSLSGSVLTTPAGLSAKVTLNDSYIIRPADTISSVFGPNNEAGLDPSFSGPGGDNIYLPTGGGNFSIYYYDTLMSSWADYSTGLAVDGASVAINYADSVVILTDGAGAPTLTVSGEVKKVATGYALETGYNFLGSVYPAGATLASSFDGAVADSSFDQSFSGPGGDVVYVPTGGGNFDLYYYDTLLNSWANYSTGLPVVGSSVGLTSGILILNDGAPTDVVNTSPSFYISL